MSSGTNTTLSFHDSEALQGAEDRVGGTSLRMDCAGPWAAREAIVGILRQGLGQRVSLLAVQLHPAPTWGTTEDPPDTRDTPLTVGLKLDPEHALSLLDKGPAANMPEVRSLQKNNKDLA